MGNLVVGLHRRAGGLYPHYLHGIRVLAASTSARGRSPARTGIEREQPAMSDVLVETTSGKIRGATKNAVHSFKGIPYGGPTGGHNRFRPPTKPESWSGTRDALAVG